jgi:hypothetical protein
MSKNKISKLSTLSTLAFALIIATPCGSCMNAHNGHDIIWTHAPVLDQAGNAIPMHDNRGYFTEEYAQAKGIGDQNADVWTKVKVLFKGKTVNIDVDYTDRDETTLQYSISSEGLYDMAYTHELRKCMYKNKNAPTNDFEMNKAICESLTKCRNNSIYKDNIGWRYAIDMAYRHCENYKDALSKYTANRANRTIHDARRYFSEDYAFKHGYKFHADQAAFMERKLPKIELQKWREHRGETNEGTGLCFNNTKLCLNHEIIRDVFETIPINITQSVGEFSLDDGHILETAYSRVMSLGPPKREPSALLICLTKTEAEAERLKQLSIYKENIGWTKALEKIKYLKKEIEKEITIKNYHFRRPDSYILDTLGVKFFYDYLPQF